MKRDDIAVTVSGLIKISRSSQTSHENADAIFETIRRVIPYAGITLLTWNRASNAHETVHSRYYPEEVQLYLKNVFSQNDPAWLRMRYEDPRPLRMQDTPYDFYAGESYLEVLGPAGYKEGLTMCLFTDAGRYTGVLHLNTEAQQDLTPEARDALHSVQPHIAEMVDELRAPEALARTYPSSSAVAVLTSQRWIRLDGRDDRPFHGPRGEQLSGFVRAYLADGMREGHFLWQVEDGGGYRSVSFVTCGKNVLVGVHDSQPTHPLTRRELQVITHVAQGLSNHSIARLLGCSERTVATHVEHMLSKLAFGSRVELAAFAIRQGVMLPNLTRGRC